MMDAAWRAVASEQAPGTMIRAITAAPLSRARGPLGVKLPAGLCSREHILSEPQGRGRPLGALKISPDPPGGKDNMAGSGEVIGVTEQNVGASREKHWAGLSKPRQC